MFSVSFYIKWTGSMKYIELQFSTGRRITLRWAPKVSWYKLRYSNRVVR